MSGRPAPQVPVREVGARHNVPPLRRSIDPVGLGLLLFAGLNLNGAILLFLGTEAFLSPVVLLLTIWMCLRYAQTARITSSYILFILAIASYLFFGALAGLLTSGGLQTRYITTYGATVLLVSAVHFWMTSTDAATQTRILTVFKYILLASCLLVILSDALKPYQAVEATPGLEADQVMEAVEGSDRASGLFGNPNEAAMVALYCIVLVAVLPGPSLPIRLLQGAIAVVALAMTFSKAGMLTLLVLTVLFLLTRRSFVTLVLSGLGLIIAFCSIWFIFDRDLLNLSWEQRERLSDVLSLAGGDFNAKSTTGRNVLFELGVERIIDTFPWGEGLGQFHSMEGGLRRAIGNLQLSEWLGVHNTYLMILGESGFIPFAALMSFLIFVLIQGRHGPHRSVVFGFVIILMADMAVAHHALTLRFANVTLGIALALAAQAPGLERLRHGSLKYST